MANSIYQETAPFLEEQTKVNELLTEELTIFDSLPDLYLTFSLQSTLYDKRPLEMRKRMRHLKKGKRELDDDDDMDVVVTHTDI